MFIIIQPRRYLSKQDILNYNSFWSLWPRIRYKDFLYDLSYIQSRLGTNSSELTYVYTNSAKRYLSEQDILNHNSFWYLWPRIRHKDFLDDLSYLQSRLGTNSSKLKYIHKNPAKKILSEQYKKYLYRILCHKDQKLL